MLINPAAKAFISTAEEMLRKECVDVLKRGIRVKLDASVEICGEGEPAERIYKIESGSVRGYKILSDGRRSIVDFYLPGDVFCLEGDRYSLSYDTITECHLLAIGRRHLMDLAATDNRISCELLILASKEMLRLRRHSSMLSKRSDERVASFLVEISERTHTGNCFDLPMSRQDIADYLGLTLETVSRSLMQMEAKAMIKARKSRHIVLQRSSALTQLST